MTDLSPSIQPWLSITNASTAAMFYKEAFGAIETYHMETPDGGLVQRFSVEGAEFWVSGQTTELNTEISNKQDIIRMVLIVQDPDTVFAQAIKAGAVEVFPVGEDHGWRLGRLTDPFGIDWEIGKLLTNV